MILIVATSLSKFRVFAYILNVVYTDKALLSLKCCITVFCHFPFYIYKIVWVIDFTSYFLALFKLILSELIDQTGS